ncbi:hypothetical protein CFC21_038912 [Triticum aestivum]|uniref:Uncharacterized protein n=5 Tax=Triticum aestivum TaxID=4565 RepID=A0A9R1FDT8_WHEAT|nr:uncharacterized protein LOC123064272 [Triticum aestivum]XP_044343721.1 uncharacterized protein LOC123064272 [Triticum aestivum]XP_044445304.1 uncharacterized protein LOC123172380 [Triticum aestivum]XP_044445305.1 uncharacterized protein LOC123172380 [Triticum aestivum]KAF7026819.1 hypothetical protein CFC21_038912 [Triticum aestivum]
MVGLLNRSRGLAEGVAVMICPVLLALALNIVDLNDEVYGHGVPIALIAMAGFTLITGICPFMVCCFLQGCPRSSVILAITSSACLVMLACFIAHFIIFKSIFITLGVICGIFLMLRTVCYYYYYLYDRPNGNVPEHTAIMQSVLDESHEFLTGITGILFLGFQGLTLDGDVRTISRMGGEPMGYISFIFITLGVGSMLLTMTPPKSFGERKVVRLTLLLDCFMAGGIFMLLLVTMRKHTQLEMVALLVFVPPIISFSSLLFLVLFPVDGQHDEDPKPASLELTKVTFTGFLAVSITTISNTSPNKFTAFFLLLSSMVIGFGLSWRLLSQNNTKSGLTNIDVSPVHVASAAKIASILTHFCIVITTILFVAMASTASGK